MSGKTVEVKCANKQCGATFTARVADCKRGWGKFCSKSCKAIKQTLQFAKHGVPYKHNSENKIDQYDGSWDAHNY